MATRLESIGGAKVLPFDQLAPMLRVIPSLPRPVLARLTERLLERLDELDGDPDLEPSGDELDGSNAEDEAVYLPQYMPRGPGCPISDEGGGNVEDELQGERDPHE